jgi:lactoylglutathione lyase
MVELQALVLNTSQMESMLEFYRAIGLEFAAGRVDKGSPVYKGKCSGIEICLIVGQPAGIKVRRDVSFRLNVKKIDEILTKIKKISGIQFVMDKTDMPYGKVAVVLDPEGNAVELIEPWPE